MVSDLAQQRLQIAMDCKGVIDDIAYGGTGLHVAITNEIVQHSKSFSECFFLLTRDVTITTKLTTSLSTLVR